ncbi:fimbrial outer membrane usher protein, partial [Escherichia coli]
IMIPDTKVRAIRSPIINIYCKRPLTLAWPPGVMLRRIIGHSATIFTKMIK